MKTALHARDNPTYDRDLVTKRSHFGEQTDATRSGSSPSMDGLSCDPITCEMLGAPPALVSWRPSARLAATERYGRFDVLGRIGRGGMAEILLAREHSRAGSVRYLVVKRILPENAHSAEILHMFLAEARVSMELSHPNLCQIYEVGERDGTWFLAMEWVHGVTLHQLAQRAAEYGDVDYGVLARVFSQCADALHYAHNARDAEGRPLHLVHRDVSPHNLMVGFDGRVKLLDFGIAKSTANTHRTESGIVKGKVCYMAPEQWLGEPLDARTDIFALGACLYEVLTGEMAFRRDTQGDVMKAVLQEPVRPISEIAPDVPKALAEIASRALAKLPAHRFQSALEMSEALERFASSLVEPISSARVAQYVRRLFPVEVELGPLLERSVRGGELMSSFVLPPMPTQTVVEGPFSGALPRLLGTAPLPGPPPLPAPTEALATPSSPPPASRDFPSLAPPTFRTEVSTRGGALPLLREPAAESTGRRVSPFSEAPTRPMPGLHESGGVETADPRPPLRTVSMHVGRRRRIAVSSGIAALCAGLALAWYPSLRTSEPDRSAEEARPLAKQARPLPPVTIPPVVVAQGRDMPAAGAAAARVLSGVTAQAALAEPPATQPQVSEGVPMAEPPTKAGRAAPEARKRRVPQASKASVLSINTRPWSTVYLGKRVLGTTPLADVPVPHGILTLKLVDRDGKVHRRRVASAKGKARSVFYDLEKRRKR